MLFSYHHHVYFGDQFPGDPLSVCSPTLFYLDVFQKRTFKDRWTGWILFRSPVQQCQSTKWHFCIQKYVESRTDMILFHILLHAREGCEVLQLACLYVCVSLCSHISKTTCPDFVQFFGIFYLWTLLGLLPEKCNTSCTSVFVDSITYHQLTTDTFCYTWSATNCVLTREHMWLGVVWLS